MKFHYNVKIKLNFTVIFCCEMVVWSVTPSILEERMGGVEKLHGDPTKTGVISRPGS